MTMTLVETVEVGSGGTFSVQISSIPQDALNLLILISSRSTEVGFTQNGEFKLNGASSYGAGKTLVGDGGSVSVLSRSSSYLGFYQPASWTSANNFSNTEIFVPNYTSSQDKKAIITSVATGNQASDGRHFNEISNMTWPSSSAVSSVELSVLLAQYSTITVYTIS